MRKRSFLIVLGLSVLLLFLVTIFYQPHKSVMVSHATPIISLQNWTGGYGEVFSNEPYLWLTDHELLHFHSNNFGVQSATFDTLKKTESSVPGLVAVYRGHAVSASPDGQWVLWNTQQYENSAPGFAATRRADGKTIRWPNFQMDRSEGFWLPDSRHWIGITLVPTGQMMHGHPVGSTRFAIFDVNHPGFQSYPIASDTGGSRILGVNTQGHVILDNSSSQAGFGQSSPPLSLSEVTLISPQPTAHPFSVIQPQTPPGESAYIFLSPQGDRLLWVNFSSRPSSIISWLSLWTRHSFVGGTESLDVWVLPLNGSASRHVGTWNSRQLSFGPAVRWNPDGKHISISLNDTLCSVPVN
jgi:hypothetical protein